MEIRINGSAADITLDNEKTVGEVMAGVDGWLSDSGHRLSGISIDGVNADISSLDEIFKRDINTVKTLDIYTSSLADLSAESLMNLLLDIKEFEKINFEEKKHFFNDWKEKAHAVFALETMPDLYNLYVSLFCSGEINADTLISVTEERLREVNDPVLEITNLGQIVEETCLRLNELALDIQTGKEGKAAQTIHIFTGISEKILRVLHQMNYQGYLTNNTHNEKPVNMILTEFGKLVQELLDAYEKNDTVLIGDIAEYEVSVKLQELYTAILKNKCEASESQGKE